MMIFLLKKWLHGIIIMKALIFRSLDFTSFDSLLYVRALGLQIYVIVARTWVLGMCCMPGTVLDDGSLGN